MKRITVILPDEVYEKVIKLAKKEKRSKSKMSAILIEDGLTMANKGVNVEISGNNLADVFRKLKNDTI